MWYQLEIVARPTETEKCGLALLEYIESVNVSQDAIFFILLDSWSWSACYVRLAYCSYMIWLFWVFWLEVLQETFDLPFQKFGYNNMEAILNILSSAEQNLLLGVTACAKKLVLN